MWTFRFIILFSVSVETMKFDSYHRALMQHFLNFSNIYSTKHVLTIRSDVNDLYMTRRSIDGIKWLSKNSIYSSAVKMSQLTTDIKYYRNKINYPLLLITIVSEEDFHTYANLTRSFNAKTFRVIMIFERESRTCHNPVGNPLNLVFDSKVLVKCPDSEIIREWYSVYPNKTEIYDWVRWHRNEEQRENEFITDMLFNERRRDLGGLTIRVSFHEENIDEDGEIGGMCQELVTEIAKRVNFTIAWQPAVSYIGMYNAKTNTADGILGKLALNKTDFGMGLFALTADRLKLFDFSVPLIETRLSYYINPSNDSVNNFMKYSAMSTSAVSSIYGIMLISSIILTMTVITDKVKFSNSIFQLYMDQFFDSMAILVNGNVTHNPVRISARIIHFFLLICYLLLNAIITAKLTSLIAVYKPALPSLEELFEAKTHKLLTLSNSVYLEKLSSSKNKTTEMMRKNTVTEKSMKKLYDRICADDNSLVFYISDVMIKMKDSLPPRKCKLLTIDKGRLINMGLVFQKNSPYLDVINFHLQKFYLTGLLSAVKKKWILTGRPDEDNKHFQMATIQTVKYPHFVLIWGILLSFIILICEKIYHRFFAR